VKSLELLSFKDENQPPGGSRTKPSLDQRLFMNEVHFPVPQIFTWKLLSFVEGVVSSP